MKKLVLNIALVAGVAGPLAACTQTEQNVAAGTIAGAAIGQAVGRDTGSTVAGAVAGGAIGLLLSDKRDSRGLCLYRDRQGREFRAECPK